MNTHYPWTFRIEGRVLYLIKIILDIINYPFGIFHFDHILPF